MSEHSRYELPLLSDWREPKKQEPTDPIFIILTLPAAMFPFLFLLGCFAFVFFPPATGFINAEFALVFGSWIIGWSYAEVRRLIRHHRK